MGQPRGRKRGRKWASGVQEREQRAGPTGQKGRGREARKLGLRAKTENKGVFLFILFFFYFKTFSNPFLKHYEFILNLVKT
jgi:hypothetical protein